MVACVASENQPGPVECRAARKAPVRVLFEQANGKGVIASQLGPKKSRLDFLAQWLMLPFSGTI